VGRLIIICGTSFSGKTTLGAAIARRFGYALVDVDDTKSRLYGPDARDDDLSREDWIRIYDDTDEQIERHLRQGQMVIDASRNFRREERRRAARLAAGVGAEVVTIFVDTPEAVTRRRLLANRRTQARVDIAGEEFEHILRVWETPGADERPLVFRHGDDLDAWIGANLPDAADEHGTPRDRRRRPEG
jgi:predicted kinase